MNIFRTFWRAVREMLDEMFILFISNLLWCLINLPLIFCVVLVMMSASPVMLAVALLVALVSFGPANAGLFTIAQRVTEGRTSSWRDFIAGMRSYARLSWKIYGLWVVGLGLILFNLQFYNMNGSQIAALLSVLFLYLLLVWCALLIYLGPLMLLQEDKRVRTIARNAGLMVFGRPVFTLGTLVLMIIIAVTSIWIPILAFAISFAFLALWGFRATLTLIAEAEARQERLAAAGNAPAAKGRGGQVRPRE